MASISSLQLQFISYKSSVVTKTRLSRFNGASVANNGWRRFTLRAIVDNNAVDLQSQYDIAKNQNANSKKGRIDKLRGVIRSLPPVDFLMKGKAGSSLAGTFLAATLVLVIIFRMYASRKKRYRDPGSVADLVRRGQLRSDRRGISKPLKYDDPFNNPLVKVGKSSSTVEMFGKVYRMAPVTLTEQERDIHRKRRSRAYQWKRPTIFLKEGDSIPPDADPDSIRWIPANHPFATTVSDIDENLAQNNVYQKHGVPSRIQAEHEALQKKLEALENDPKSNKLGMDRSKELDGKPDSTIQNPFLYQEKDSNASRMDDGQSSSSASDGTRKP